MYVAQNNVWVVRGAKNSCIYDLNTKKLYHLDSVYTEYFCLIKEGRSQHSIPGKVIDSFLDAGIVVPEEKVVPALDEFTYSGHIDFSWIEITQNCNLFCRHCYEGSARTITTPEMSFDNFQIAVDSLKKAGIRRVQLVGGEPLTHSTIRNLIDYISWKFDFTEIFTNGTLLTDELLDLIQNRGISLAFSVYSDKPEIHDFVTCTPGSYNITMATLQKAKDRGIRVRTSSVEMIQVPRFSFGDQSIEHRVDFPRLTGRASLKLYSRDMAERKLITKESFQNPIDPEMFFKSRVIHNCFGERLYIDCDLNVYPCAMERRVSYGNLRHSSVEELILNPYMRMTKDHIKECCDCEFRYACYDCRPDCNGAPIDSKPWYCTYDPKNGVWADKETFLDSLFIGENRIEF